MKQKRTPKELNELEIAFRLEVRKQNPGVDERQLEETVKQLMNIFG